MSPKINNSLPQDKDNRIAQLEQALALEAALEKVRARTMTMQKSNELADVASLIFQLLKEMQVVGIEDRFHFALHNEEAGITQTWITEPNGYKIVKGFDFPIAEFPPLIKKNYRRWEKTPKFERIQLLENTIYKGKDLEDFLAMLSDNPLFAEEKSHQVLFQNTPDQIAQNGANFSHGVLVVTSTRQFEEKELRLLQRFAIVFEQTYTRFLDLKKAEAQTREAQIEAALERVRARTMAMHKSEELPEAAKVMFEQFKTLGITPGSCAFTIFRNGTPIADNYWASNQVETMAPMVLSHHDEPVLKGFYNAWKAKIPLHVEEVKGLRYAKHLEYMLKIPSVGQSVKEINNQGIALPERMVFNCANFKYGYVMFSTHEQRPAYHDIFIRFGKVFEQTYTRFLDLEKAEAQAREAQIEAAMERIRNRAIAMRSSEELKEVIIEMRRQIDALGQLDLEASVIHLYTAGAKMFESFAAVRPPGESGEIVIANILFPVDAMKQIEYMIEMYHSNEQEYTIEFDKTMAEEWQEVMVEHAPMIAARRVGFVANRRTSDNPEYWNFADFSQGSLLLVTHSPASEDTKEVLRKAAQVFDQVYTRFLDLQKAEAQAREAQIEAALERVRAASMAMHKSIELSNVAAVLFAQIAALKVAGSGCGVMLLDDGPIGKMYYSVGGELIPEMFPLPVHEDKELRTMYDVWKAGKAYYVHHVYGEALVKHDQNLEKMFRASGNERFLNITKEYKKHGHTHDEIFAHHAYFKNGCILLMNDHEIEEKNILLRFAKVFEQSYTRFLDLQKVEAQAREAQIEAALERVRAASMAMHKSEELPTVALTFFKQIEQLGIPIAGATINIVNAAQKTYQLYFAINNKIGISSELSIDDFWFAKESYHQLKKGKTEFTIVCEGKKLQEVIEFNKREIWKEENSKEEVLRFKSLKIKKHYSHSLQFHDLSHTIFIGVKPFSEATLSVLRRMTKVFGMSYVRFLDLQKAEKQAQEIEKVFNENQRLLHSILPEQIAEQIRQGQQTVVKRFEQVSILFADIVGFTVLSDKLSPQEVVDILNGLFSKFDDLTDKYGLEKIKTIGDAYMVAAGVPEEKEDHAQRIFAFAKDMLQTLQGYNKVIGTDLKIRIGISSGPVVAGVIGKKKFAYDLWGDTVNTAARMEAYGQASCIQVAPPSYELLKEEFEFEKIPKVEIKGKGVMDVYVWSPPFTG